MFDREMTREDAQGWYFDQVERAVAGMLGIVGSRDHFQPMAPQVDRETGQIWFFTKKDSDIVTAVGQGNRAHFIVINSDAGYYACCRGAIVQDMDVSKRDQFWSADIAAWFEEGRDDGSLTMLRFTPTDASVWASTDNALVFGWSMLKASLTSSTPDAGERAIIRF